MFLRLFFSITDEQHPNHSFIKLSNPSDFIVSNMWLMIIFCINDIHSIVEVLALVTTQCVTVSFLASLSGKILIAFSVCNATIFGVRYKVSRFIVYLTLSHVF